MLDRVADRRRDSRQRQAAYRARLQASRIVVPVEIDEATVSWLVRTRWLTPREYHTRREIADAIAALLADSAHS